ncbi:hypothetical protein M413DRAFT_31884 [Hebeloma cylindrosporum]|uniref:Uncharacterized protein n=1 Tax=Hebeloma cylindrosporum TaxID=76867 RepID=A0A0C3BVP2_HEBCY|nr:hypothetical protein M413DRAFT_31884 [Hebeloma cylindrosporum h7]
MAEELEEDNLQAENEYIQETGHQLKSQKGQGVWQQEDEDEFDGKEYEDCEEAEDGEEYEVMRRLRIVKSMKVVRRLDMEKIKDQAYRLHREYVTAMEDLAHSCGKPPKAIFRLVYDENATHYTLASWNAYQSWYALCGEKKRPKDMLGSEWMKVIVAEYHAKIESLGDQSSDPDAITELFQISEIRYHNWSLCKSGYEHESGLILFRYLIDTMGNPNGTNSSIAWGGAPLYKEFRMKKAAMVTQQTIDYVMMFQSLEMDKVKQIQYQPPIRKPREYHCIDLVKIMGSRTPGLANGNAIHMQWTTWANQAFENQLTLLNWFLGRQCPGNPSFKLKQLTRKEVNQAVAARQKAMKCPDDPEWDSVIHIISWSDSTSISHVSLILHLTIVSDERSQSLKDQSNIPLIIDSDSKVLLQVKHSKRYKQQMGGKKLQVSNNEGNEGGESKSEEAPVTQSGGCPSCREPSPTPSGSEDELQACNVSVQCSSNIEPEQREPESHNISVQCLPNVEPEQQEPESCNVSVQCMHNIEREQREPEPHNFSVQCMHNAKPEHLRSDDHRRPMKCLCITQDIDS